MITTLGQLGEVVRGYCRRGRSPHAVPHLVTVSLAALAIGLCFSGRTLGQDITPISQADRTDRPKLFGAAERVLEPWKQLHFGCVGSVTVTGVATDATLTDLLRNGDTEAFERPLTAVVERAYSHCRPYLEGMSREIEHWNGAVPKHPITAEYRRDLLDASIGGAFVGAKSAIARYVEDPAGYEILPPPDQHAQLVAELAENAGTELTLSKYGPYVTVVRAAQARLAKFQPPF